MTPRDILVTAIDPACALLAKSGIPSDDRARVLMMAIAGQESAWQYRRQIGGPARGFWQFEKGGGLDGVARTSPAAMKALCDWCLVPYDNMAVVFEALAWHDVMAAGLARLLLWADPAPLPAVGEVQAGWDYYERNWRPGAPHPEVWPGRYGTAMGQVNSNPVKGP